MKKPSLIANRPALTAPFVAPSIDGDLYDTPPAAEPAPVTAKSVPAGGTPKARAASARPKAASEPEVGETVSKVVFTNQLQPDVYWLVRQYEHHAGVEIRDILDAALREYLIPKRDAHQPLPPARAAKIHEKLLKK